MHATDTATSMLLRLNPNEDSGWIWYPAWENRVIEAAKSLSPWIPSDQLKSYLRQKWATMPASLGAWLLFQDVAKPCAHACAWIQPDWGVISALIFQVQADPGCVVTDWTDRFLADVQAWKDEADELYRQANSPMRVTRTVFCTERGAAFGRYLKQRVSARRTLELIELD